MNLKGLAAVVARAGLPALGAAIAGPAGATVARRVAAQLGLPEEDPEVIAAAVEAQDPATLVRLREVEAEAAAAELAAATRAAELQVEDVQHARINARDDTVRRRLAVAMPIVTVVFASVFIGLLVWKNQITDAIGIAGLVLGWLIRDASSSNAFYFGTSLGSVKKSVEIGKMNRPE